MRILSIACCVFIMAISVCAEGLKGLKEYEYWDSGKTKKCTIYDVDGYLKGKVFYRQDGTIEKAERYNPDGNKTEAAFYDQDGKLKAGIDGWAAMRWWYDDAGQLRLHASYDEDGIAIERKYYSAGGNMVFRQFKSDGSVPNPYEQASMAMMLGPQNVAYYDAKERLQDTVRLVTE